MHKNVGAVVVIGRASIQIQLSEVAEAHSNSAIEASAGAFSSNR
jgi:hypothetical protein